MTVNGETDSPENRQAGEREPVTKKNRHASFTNGDAASHSTHRNSSNKEFVSTGDGVDAEVIDAVVIETVGDVLRPSSGVDTELPAHASELDVVQLPNYAATGGAVASFVLGVWAILWSFFTMSSLIVALIGFPLGLWGLNSPAKRTATIGLGALVAATVLGLVGLYADHAKDGSSNNDGASVFEGASSGGSEEGF